MSQRFKRVLLKLSGEALLGEKSFGIDHAVVGRLANEVAEAARAGLGIGMVIGGGNLFRGLSLAAGGANRVTGDQLGMLATVMNAIVFRDALIAEGMPARVFSAMPVPAICESFTQRAAEAAFAAGEVVLFAGGTGNPFFTTDSGAALRAAEMGCDALLKATQVDGIYSADPKRDPDAVRYDRLTYTEVLARGLEVMDAAAIALARDNRIPVIVFSIHEPGALSAVLAGKGRSTVVADD